MCASSVCSRQQAWGLHSGILQALVSSLGFKLWWVEPYRVEAKKCQGQTWPLGGAVGWSVGWEAVTSQG